ncbi:hypothetical protein [Streptomyces sp. SID12488]|uniref:hypothetical protein n=1 Tax=Streptomyces sp. SID12488 TaxID=2706040 RepID=UPI0013DD6100|nr:hypothetical protein [Streptomyces sp. SID12488]NEA62238.1 hypothetical protein [Streptomyces sp. SID12488]
MTIAPDSVRGRLVHARRTNPWALLWGRLVLWAALSVLAGLTPVAVPGAPVWIWPFTLVACLLMAGRTIGVMRRKKRDGSGSEKGRRGDLWKSSRT